MSSIVYRTCEVTKWESIYALCELHYVNNNYIVIVKEDSEDLFFEFNIEIDKNEPIEIVIKNFEAECLNRFTCYGHFTVDEVKDNSGEEIAFY